MKTKFLKLFIFPLFFGLSSLNSNAQTLIQYWDFNQFHPITVTAGDSAGTAYSYANTPAIDSTMNTWPLVANYVASGLTPGHIVYSRPTIHYSKYGRDSILDEGAGGSAYYDYSSVNYPYYTSSDSSNAIGNGFIRARNPSDSSIMYLYIPTSGYKNITMQYAVSTSSPGSAQYNILSYSTNGGTSWNNLTQAMDTFNIGGVRYPDTLLINNTITAASGWYPVQINFTSDPNVNNNPNFILRWRIAGSNSDSLKHNDRYDNFAIWGVDTSTGINELAAQVAGYNVFPNPVNTSVNIVSETYTGAKVISLYNVVGQTISVTENKNKQTAINTTSLSSGMYFVEIKEVSTGNKYTVKIIKE